MYKFIDLFCGIGGFHMAMKNVCENSEVVFASDIDKNCQMVYENNFGIKVSGDITKIDYNEIDDFDFLFGGFPCQPFSLAGNKKGFDDRRGNLFFNIYDIIGIKRPKYCILENVKHIEKIDDGNVINTIYTMIESLDYFITHIELNPLDFGVPQDRKRILFIIIRRDMLNDDDDNVKKMIQDNINSKKMNYISLENWSGFEENKSEKYNLPDKYIKLLDCWDELFCKLDVSSISSPIIPEFFTIYDEKDKKNEFDIVDNKKKYYDVKNGKKLYWKDWKYKYTEKNMKMYNLNKELFDVWMDKHWSYISTFSSTFRKLEFMIKNKCNSIHDYIISFRPSGIRLKYPEYFPTLVASGSIPIYKKQYLSPRECANLQSVNQEYKFLDKDNITYKQLGNGVNTLVIEIVIKTIFDLFI